MLLFWLPGMTSKLCLRRPISKTSGTPTFTIYGLSDNWPVSGGCHTRSTSIDGEDMGKYVIAWLLGVPAFVLVIIYLFAH